MSIVNDAFDPSDINRIHNRRLYDKPVAILKIGMPNHGYCESCESYQLAPKKRTKGWLCVSCVASIKRTI